MRFRRVHQTFSIIALAPTQMPMETDTSGNTRTTARRENGLWVIETRDHNSKKHQFRARILVNAAGPWVSQLTDSVIGGQSVEICV